MKTTVFLAVGAALVLLLRHPVLDMIAHSIGATNGWAY